MHVGKINAVNFKPNYRYSEDNPASKIVAVENQTQLLFLEYYCHEQHNRKSNLWKTPFRDGDSRKPSRDVRLFSSLEGALENGLLY